MELHLNYKAIQHHLRVLEKNNLVLRLGGNYGATFFISPLLEANLGEYERLIVKLQTDSVSVPSLYVR